MPSRREIWDCNRGLRDDLEVCGIVLEIRGSSQALVIIWERSGVVRGCWAGDNCQGQAMERGLIFPLPPSLLLALHGVLPPG